MNKEFYTDYKTAVNWLGANILCNKIPELDPSIYDNARFNWYEDDEEPYPREIYQWYITPLDEDEIEWMEKTFKGLLYTYSDLLDCYILCVDHFGTPWSGVPIQVLSQSWINSNKDLEYKEV